MTQGNARIPAIKTAFVLLLFSCTLVIGCDHHQSASQTDQQKQLEPTSQTPPKLEALPRTAPVTASATPTPSQGECAPKYANGLHGSCINNQPCRGFGVLDEKGQAACACYAKMGGCSEGDRCDAIKKACVPEKEPGFGRAPED